MQQTRPTCTPIISIHHWKSTSAPADLWFGIHLLLKYSSFIFYKGTLLICFSEHGTMALALANHTFKKCCNIRIDWVQSTPSEYISCKCSTSCSFLGRQPASAHRNEPVAAVIMSPRESASLCHNISGCFSQEHINIHDEHEKYSEGTECQPKAQGWPRVEESRWKEKKEIHISVFPEKERLLIQLLKPGLVITQSATFSKQRPTYQPEGMKNSKGKSSTKPKICL